MFLHLCVFIALASSASASMVKVGDITTIQHDVKGSVHVSDESTIVVKESCCQIRLKPNRRT